MDSNSTRNLWDPSRGIRFAEKKPIDSITYPTIDFSRFSSSVAGFEGKLAGEPLGTDGLLGALSKAGLPDESKTPPAGDVPLSPPTEQGAEPGSPSATEASDAALEPPFTSLEYKISETAFRDAQAAKKDSPESFWSYTMYRGPMEDGAEKKVKVHYCRSKHTAERACQYFVNEKVLGFDLEWSPDANKFQGPRKNVSLIQLASPSRIALFHVALFPSKDDLVAPTFKKIMEDDSVAKVGVAIKADCTRLRNFLHVDTKGIFELSHLYKLVNYSRSQQPKMINKRLVPLAKQVEEHLHLPLFKGEVVRSSDWTLPLDMTQIIYSASDAYAGLQLYHVLEQERESLVPCPPRPYYAELGLPIRLADGVTELSAEEEVEAVEPKDATTLEPLPISLVDAICESVEVDEDDNVEKPVSISVKVTPRKRASATLGTPKTPKIKDSRVTAAESWLANYRSTKTTLRAPPCALRAYHVWYEDKSLNPEGVAKILREPPLKTTTVVGYILDAVRRENLPAEADRLRGEVLSLLPKEAVESRYRDLVRDAEDAAGAGTGLAS